MRLHNRHTKKPKSFVTVMYETYKDFAENTSIHGLKYTVKSDIGVGEKIFWALILLAAMSSAIYMTLLFWQRYISNPTRTTIKSYYAPTTAIEFPAVTICHTNAILETKLDSFLNTLNLDDVERPSIRNAFAQLVSFTDPNAVEYNETDIDILQNVLSKTQYNVSTVMRNLAQNCEEMLTYCAWNAVAFNCTKSFNVTLSSNGYCCSFNYRRTEHNPLFTPYNGINSGLLVLLNPMPQSVQYTSLHFTGYKIIIHDPTEYPGPQSTTKMLSASKLSYLHLYGSKMTCSNAVQMLPFSHRNCLYPDEFQLSSFPTYSDSNCLIECEAMFLYKRCKCVPYYYKFVGKPQCNVTQISCLLNIRKVNRDYMDNCDCPSQCEDDFYNVLSAQTSFDYNKSYSMLSIGNINTNDSSTLLNVFFSEQSQPIYLRDTVFTTVYLLSSFGGVYSLFLGCSLITVIEIVYYATARFVINLKIFDKASIEPEISIKPKNPIRTNYYQKWHNSTFLP